MNHNKLIKLLNLTTSSNDHESLSAIRMANNLLTKENLSWEQIIQRPAQEMKIKHEDIHIEDMLARCTFSPYCSEKTRIFLEGLSNYWLKHKYLTNAQYNRLNEIYEQLESRTYRK